MGEIYPPALTVELPRLRYPTKENKSYIHLCLGKAKLVFVSIP